MDKPPCWHLDINEAHVESCRIWPIIKPTWGEKHGRGVAREYHDDDIIQKRRKIAVGKYQLEGYVSRFITGAIMDKLD